MRTRQPSAHWLVKLLPAVAVVGLVGCNGLPLGLVGGLGANAGAAGSVIPGDEARFKAEATAATFAPDFKANDANGDGQWATAELATFLMKNPLPEAFLLELEAMGGASAAFRLQQEASASATATVDVIPAGLDERVRKLLAALLAKFDANGDRSLSASEALALRNEAYKRRTRPAAQNPANRPPTADDKQGMPGPDGMNKPGFAPGEPMPGMPGGMMPPGDCKADFAQADANRDGLLSWEEQWAFLQSRMPGANGPVASAIAMDKDATYAEFKRRDANGDGSLSPEEHCAMTGGVMPPPQPPVGEDCYGRYKQADRNADASLSWEEFYALEGQMAPPPDGAVASNTVAFDPALKDRLNERFRKADANGNGSLEPEEWRLLCGGNQPPVMPPLAGDCVKLYDLNGDGRLGPDEWLRANPDAPREELKLKFEGTDRNRDGFLDAFELGCGGGTTTPPTQPTTNCEEGFKMHDRNRDGRLELGEFSAFMDAAPKPADSGVASSIARDWSMEFKNRDRNGDGFIDPAEACGANTQPNPTATPPVANPIAPCDEFKRRDVNADGKVSLEEHIRAATGGNANVTAEMKLKLEAEFKQRDANGDGALTREEVGCR